MTRLNPELYGKWILCHCGFALWNANKSTGSDWRWMRAILFSWPQFWRINAFNHKTRGFDGDIGHRYITNEFSWMARKDVGNFQLFIAKEKCYIDNASWVEVGCQKNWNMDSNLYSEWLRDFLLVVAQFVVWDWLRWPNALFLSRWSMVSAGGPQWGFSADVKRWCEVAGGSMKIFYLSMDQLGLSNSDLMSEEWDRQKCV